MYTFSQKAYCLIIRSFIRLIGLIFKQKKQVLFESFSGNQYSCNPKAISEAFHKKYPEFDIVWAFNKKSHQKLMGDLPDYIKVVEKTKFNISYYYSIAVSFCYVTNIQLEPFFYKNNKQLFIQTWHGDRAFKKVLYDVWENGERPRPILDRNLTDVCIAGSKYGENQFRSAFHYNGEIMLEGTPRNDCLINVDEVYALKVRSKLNLSNEQKVLLYAPTLRSVCNTKNKKQSIQSIDIYRTLNILENHFGGNWVCLLRAHPAISGLSGIQEDGIEIIDVSKYPDMADLLLISDVLITDYSSCAGDFALLGRPLYLFQDDIQNYIENERKFYFQIEDSPYMIAHTQDELEDLICKTTKNSARNNCDDILLFYQTKETGNTSYIVADRIADFYYLNFK